MTILMAAALAAAPLACDGGANDLGTFMAANHYQAVELVPLATGHQMLRASINGVEGNFVLDSAAGAIAIDAAQLDKYFGDREPDSQRTSTGLAGEVVTNVYEDETISVGGRDFAVAAVSSLDLGPVSAALLAATGEQVDGVIGQPLLQAYGGVIDGGCHRLFLTQDRIT